MRVKERDIYAYVTYNCIRYLIFILVNVLCFSMLCPSIINSAIQNDEITQEMTNKVMTVINQYTYRLPDITIKNDTSRY